MVGEPINRVLSMHAKGLPGSLLPPFKELEIGNIKTYVDPPDVSESAEEDGLVSSSITTVGIVPTIAGPITLPEIRIPWWNTQTDSEEVVVIPAATYDVLPSVGSDANVPSINDPCHKEDPTSGHPGTGALVLDVYHPGTWFAVFIYFLEMVECP